MSTVTHIFDIIIDVRNIQGTVHTNLIAYIKSIIVSNIT